MPRTLRGTLTALPPGIWALGIGSLLMDSSSELIHSLLPIFMTTVLGASVATVGVIEGVAEATAAITKVFSGALSDRLRRRKPIVVFGYGLAALSKVIFPLAGSVGWVFAGRFADRVGKGIRGAPRDALIAEITTPEQRGAAYGLRQALDSVGAVIGPLLAVVLMAALLGNIKAVLWVAVIPAVLAVVVLMTVVREPQSANRDGPVRVPLSLAAARALDSRYWKVVALGAVFTLARFSEAFLILRAQNVGLAIALVPLVMIAMNVVYALGAFPAGVAADRLSRRVLLVTGLIVLAAADIVLAGSHAAWQVMVGTMLWGLHMALTQGLFSKLVADAAPDSMLGTAFGVFNLVSGVALIVASALAGWLWEARGPAAPFIAGAAFAALAAIGLMSSRARKS
jgi:MFS family permease